MNNNVLYYPTIEFKDYAWLWSASLLWDRIYRIVPKGYQPDEPENVKILTDTGEIGIPIHPDSYAKETAEIFLKKIKSKEWTAAALSFEISAAYSRIHQDKVDVELRNIIIAKGCAAAQDEWLHVPVEFEALYMTYLAERISRRNNLPIISDSAAAWTGATYFKYDGEVEDFPYDEQTQQLATLVIRDIVPYDILNIRPDSIIKYRDKYRDERQRFLNAIRIAAKELSNCEDEGVYKDKLDDLKKEIESSLKDIRRSMRMLNVAAWTGIKSISFPVVLKVAEAISGKQLDPTTLKIVSALGVGIGLVSGFSDWKDKRRQIIKKSDYSYLLQLQRSWKGSAIHSNDYNYYLCRKMEEFIND